MSFFLQLFALISPLFFQVVIDKVLVQALSTLDAGCRSGGDLDVQTILGCGPSVPHTTNRIDVTRRACSTTCWLCRWPASRRGASAIGGAGALNGKISAIFSPVRP